ncbi:TetR/AcrR family transcriptional regulator [Kineococcus gypseus]|uniref:TetR/AcrR family transcriptional regulator n=1 Tax=Kineococcus gypseus TaxID=1637102 RepID=UPI003D7EC144
MTGTRRLRADAERSTERILEAAEAVLAEDPGAPLERVADAAGLARATVHRRFSTRGALLEALGARLDARYRQAFEESAALTDEPRAALERLARRVFELKVGNRFALGLSDSPGEDVLDLLDRLVERLRAAGDVTASDAAWCRGVCLALLEQVHLLPAGSPALDGDGPQDPGSPDDPERAGARATLFVRAFLGALGPHGGSPAAGVSAARNPPAAGC